jgi:hypothetical protein
LTQKERETLEKPSVDESEALAEQIVKPWKDKVKQAAEARKAKGLTEKARQKFLDETIDRLAAEQRENGDLNDSSTAYLIIERVNAELERAGFKQTSDTRIRKRLQEARG